MIMADNGGAAVAGLAMARDQYSRIKFKGLLAIRRDVRNALHTGYMAWFAEKQTTYFLVGHLGSMVDNLLEYGP